MKDETGLDYEGRLGDFRQVVDDTTGKCWWQILCRWCKIVLEQYEREKFPKSVPLSVMLKIAAHSLHCPELWKHAKKDGSVWP
jgi:hypothetical protein